MKAISRYVRITSKKANLIASLVRTMKVNDALDFLKFTPKKGARILYKVIKSAKANATNNFNQIEDDLYIGKILVSEGPSLKRFIPVSRGRAHPILKRMSHILVELEVKGEKKGKSEKVEGKSKKVEGKNKKEEDRNKKEEGKEKISNPKFLKLT